MAYPLITGTTILAEDFNSIQTVLTEVIGVGDDGYGFSVQNSIPITSSERIFAWHLRGLIGDLNQAYKHITNNYTLTGLVVYGATVTSVSATGTTIKPGPLTAIYDAAQYVLANRYTCHPDQYYVDPVTGADINTTEGTSTRTLVEGWGVGTWTTITHEVYATWSSRLTARYFFNAGGKLEWKPYYTTATVTGRPLNDLDAEWSRFFDHMQAGDPWTYDRSDYVNYTTTVTNYSSGTLRIDVVAEKDATESNVKCTISFYDSDAPTLEVVPSSAFWNIII